MPNWCEHDLTITGPVSERQRFLDAVTVSIAEQKRENAEQLSRETEEAKQHNWPAPKPRPEPCSVSYAIISRLLPIPDELSNTSSPNRDPASAMAMTTKYGAPDWYEWQRANWGIKWGDCRTKMVGNSDRTTRFKFETPWAPADPAYRNISREFPELTFTYRFFERGMQFQGKRVYLAGKCILSTESKYKGKRGG